MKYRIGMLVVCMGSLLTGWANEVDEEVIHEAVTQEVQEMSLALGNEKMNEAQAFAASIHQEMEFHALKHEIKILVEQLVGLKSKLQQVEEENELYQSACNSLQSLVLRLGNVEDQISELQEVIKIQNVAMTTDQKIESSADMNSGIDTAAESLVPGNLMVQPAVERKFHGAWRVFSSLFRSKVKS